MHMTTCMGWIVDADTVFAADVVSGVGIECGEDFGDSAGAVSRLATYINRLLDNQLALSHRFFALHDQPIKIIFCTTHTAPLRPSSLFSLDLKDIHFISYFCRMLRTTHTTYLA